MKCIGMRGVFAMLFIIAVAGAATPESTLLDNGRSALYRLDYPTALMYLYAYIERDPVDMQGDAAFAAQVRKGAEVARQAVVSAIAQRDQLQRENANLRARLTGTGSSVSGITIAPPQIVKSAQPQTWPMICKGGGNLGVSLQTSGYGITGPTFVLEFQRGQTAYPAGLNPGECTWMDRGVGAAEPNRICHRIDPTMLDLHWTPGGAVTSRSAPYLAALSAPDGTYTFKVYNNGQGCMFVTELARPNIRVLRPVVR